MGQIVEAKNFLKLRKTFLELQKWLHFRIFLFLNQLTAKTISETDADSSDTQITNHSALFVLLKTLKFSTFVLFKLIFILLLTSCFHDKNPFAVFTPLRQCIYQTLMKSSGFFARYKIFIIFRMLNLILVKSFHLKEQNNN